MTEFKIRQATLEDVPAIAKLWFENTHEVAKLEPIYTPSINPDEASLRLEHDFNSGTKSAFVAYQGTDFAGYVTYKIDEEDSAFNPRRFIYLIDVDVATAYREQGLSYKLLAEVEAYARMQGIMRLELSVMTADNRAKEVWQRHGFRPHLMLLHKDLS